MPMRGMDKKRFQENRALVMRETGELIAIYRFEAVVDAVTCPCCKRGRCTRAARIAQSGLVTPRPRRGARETGNSRWARGPDVDMIMRANDMHMLAATGH